jgi:hypothetical protein
MFIRLLDAILMLRTNGACHYFFGQALVMSDFSANHTGPVTYCILANDVPISNVDVTQCTENVNNPSTRINCSRVFFSPPPYERLSLVPTNSISQ